ncbi:MAG TPA: HD domain-containing phosphohydrolase [Candidatus Acidoferrum sp.]|nr:HD domain-containing phosphohydrolase [Candidatus Acidoferrum sp.]
MSTVPQRRASDRRPPAPRALLRYKIILPFIALLLFIGVFGTTVVTQQVSDTAVAEFDSSLLRASLLANDHFAVLEADRLAQLRAATDTVGVADAVAAADLPTLIKLLTPIQANTRPANIVLRVLDQQGNQLQVIPQPSGTDPTVSNAKEFADEPLVRRVLAGTSDAAGDRYVFLAADPAGPTLYWAGPIRSSGSRVVGAVLLGERLSDITQGIRSSRASELIFYEPSGAVLSSSLPMSPALPANIATLAGQDQPVRFMETLSGHRYGVLFTDWTMRGVRLGYLGVALPADPLDASLTQIKGVLILLFVLAALLTLFIGGVLANRISRPIEQLVASTRAVAAGDLTHRAKVRGRDEIGYLARSFNDMTASLEGKTRALEESYFASMEALARALDARDASTFGHSARVAAMSMELADALALAPLQREALRRAALLHDIGKIGVDDRILRKPGPLNKAELAEIREHPLTGYDMLKGLPFLQASLAAVRHHHERWDGMGYPDRLKGEAIPMVVRILSVADVFDAVTSKRPYRTGVSLESAMKVIKSGAGTQFDPDVVKAFEKRAKRIVELSRAVDQMSGDPGDFIWMEDAG